MRYPFYTGGSVAGISDFSGRTAQLNLLPATRLDPNAIKLLQLYPKSNRAGFTNNYFQAPKSPNTTNQYDIGVDQNFGSKDILFGVFDWTHNSAFQPALLPGLANGQNYGTGTTAVGTYLLAAGYTHLFTPTLINEFHFGYMHLKSDALPPERQTLGTRAQFGIQGIPSSPATEAFPQSILAGLRVSAYLLTLPRSP